MFAKSRKSFKMGVTLAPHVPRHGGFRGTWCVDCRPRKSCAALSPRGIFSLNEKQNRRVGCVSEFFCGAAQRVCVHGNTCFLFSAFGVAARRKKTHSTVARTRFALPQTLAPLFRARDFASTKIHVFCFQHLVWQRKEKYSLNCSTHSLRVAVDFSPAFRARYFFSS